MQRSRATSFAAGLARPNRGRGRAGRTPLQSGRNGASRRRSDGAQSLAELALILPAFLILALGIIDFGMGLRAYISVAAATREGARYAAVGNPAGTFVSGGTGDCNGSTTTTTVGKVCSTLDGLGLGNVQNVSVTYPDGNTPGNSVHVRTQYRYHYITPLQRVVNVLSGGSLPGYLTLSSVTDMRLE